MEQNQKKTSSNAGRRSGPDIQSRNKQGPINFPGVLKATGSFVTTGRFYAVCTRKFMDFAEWREKLQAVNCKWWVLQ